MRSRPFRVAVDTTQRCFARNNLANPPSESGCYDAESYPKDLGQRLLAARGGSPVVSADRVSARHSIASAATSSGERCRQGVSRRIYGRSTDERLDSESTAAAASCDGWDANAVHDLLGRDDGLRPQGTVSSEFQAVGGALRRRQASECAGRCGELIDLQAHCLQLRDM